MRFLFDTVNLSQGVLWIHTTEPPIVGVGIAIEHTHGKSCDITMRIPYIDNIYLSQVSNPEGFEEIERR